MAERPEPLTEAELRELEDVVDYVVRSEGKLHGPDDWKHVGQLLAKYAPRMPAELNVVAVASSGLYGIQRSIVRPNAAAPQTSFCSGWNRY